MATVSNKRYPDATKPSKVFKNDDYDSIVEELSKNSKRLFKELTTEHVELLSSWFELQRQVLKEYLIRTPGDLKEIHEVRGRILQMNQLEAMIKGAMDMNKKVPTKTGDLHASYKIKEDREDM